MRRRAVGATVTYAKQLVHGKQSEVEFDPACPLFRGCEAPLLVARYHSLAADPATLPPELKITARTADGEVMAVQHTKYPIYNHYKDDPEFNRELTELLNEYAGRPSRLYYAKKMTEDLGGAKIYLKREDLNHTGAHKINNVLGQALLAKKMGKTRLIAETGAGQHGVATATAAALMGMECVVFMGEEDTKRQALNVYRMRLLGAEVIPVASGTGTLKDAVRG